MWKVNVAKYLCVGALALLPGNGAVAAESLYADGADKKIVFRYDGTEGYDICYRIPSIVRVMAGKHAGRIIAINDYRYSGADIGAGRIDLYQSYSDDNGATWSKPNHFRNKAGEPVAQGDGTKTATCGFGDAASVSDRESGELLVLAVGGHRNFFRGRRDKPNYCFSWRSGDGGESWTRRDVTEQILRLFDGEEEYGNVDSQFFGSGRIAQSSRIKTGDNYRLYAALTTQNGGWNTRNWVLYSDNFGDTWEILGGVPCVTEYGDEPKVEELPDGSVLLASRRQNGNRHFNIFSYDDIASATGKWSGVVATDMGMGPVNACDGEILILQARDNKTGEDCYLALQSFPYGGKRENVSIAWRKIDYGMRMYDPEAFCDWEGRYQVTDKPSAYSTMVELEDGSIGFLFEETTFPDKDYCGIFERLTLPQITSGRYCSR